MSEIIFLDEAPQPIEIRDVEKREIEGRIVPFNERIQIRGRPEYFKPGALSNIDPKQTRLLRNHDRNNPLGKMVGLEEREDGAYGVFRVSRTRAGDEALELAKDGVLSFSPGFIPGTQERDGGIASVKSLPEVSLVTFPAYAGAQVMSVRSESKEDSMSDTPTNEVAETVEAQPDLSALESRFDSLEQAIARIEVRSVTPEPKAEVSVTPLDWFIAETRAEVLGDHEKREKVRKALETRSLAQVQGVLDDGSPSNADGLVQQAYLPGQLVHVLDARRPFFAALGRFPMPKSGYARIPVVTQNTKVDTRNTQFGEPASQALTVSTQDFNAVWLDGAVEVSLEIIQTSEPGVMGMIWDDLLAQLAGKQEALAISTMVNAGTETGDALPKDTYKNFAKAVATQAIQVRNATGAAANSLAIPYDEWPDIIAMVDANDIGHPQANPSNSLVAESFTLPGGIRVFAADVPAAVLFNQEAARASDEGPSRVEATSVSAMARQIGLLGRVMLVPRIPAGIRVFDEASSSSSSSS